MFCKSFVDLEHAETVRNLPCLISLETRPLVAKPFLSQLTLAMREKAITLDLSRPSGRLHSFLLHKSCNPCFIEAQAANNDGSNTAMTELLQLSF